MLHKDEPVVIKEIGLVVYGTHSHAKMKVTVGGVFSNLNETFTLPLHHKVDDIEIKKKAAQFLSKGDSSVQVMDTVSYETFDAEAGQDVLESLSEGDMVTFVEYGGKARVLEKRE